jgi:hypothetical protein
MKRRSVALIAAALAPLFFDPIAAPWGHEPASPSPIPSPIPSPGPSSGPITIPMVVPSTNAPISGGTPTGSSGSGCVPKRAPAPKTPEEQIKILEAEINARKATNLKLQPLIDDYNVDELKGILANSVINAKGQIVQENFDKQTPEIQKEMKDFETGGSLAKYIATLPRDSAQSLQLGLGGMSNLYSPGAITVMHARIEMIRNNLFIEQLQQKIAGLKATGPTPAPTATP